MLFQWFLVSTNVSSPGAPAPRCGLRRRRQRHEAAGAQRPGDGGGCGAATRWGVDGDFYGACGFNGDLGDLDAEFVGVS